MITPVIGNFQGDIDDSPKTMSSDLVAQGTLLHGGALITHPAHERMKWN